MNGQAWLGWGVSICLASAGGWAAFGIEPAVLARDPAVLSAEIAATPNTPIAANSIAATVTPLSPQLGDTLTVRIQIPTGGEVPQVAMGDRQFPVFVAVAADERGLTTYRALVPTSPLDRPGARNIVVTVAGQQQQLSTLLRDRQFPTQSITVREGGLQATQLEWDAVSAFKAIVSPEQLWQGSFLRPTQGAVSSIYGVRRYYNGVFARDYYHRGVDYAAATGTPVYAPAAGRIALVGREAEGFAIHGNTVGIDHGQGVVSIFLHLNRISVSEGERVTAGTPIGQVGSTGASTGPHLHWGLYVHNVAVDPVPWRYGKIE
ncbi:M23 family metallopeptidase [Synechococcus sp. PCC 7336]|uniref:M23 family metallopeptidase n=1 Tax=Synechococcus sp. PCC 7336 TaxID=195250 RepID=UPI0003498781|nr:M23 family metallopeptidase [Synechococcus sp. PCC 7336]